MSQTLQGKFTCTGGNITATFSSSSNAGAATEITFSGQFNGSIPELSSANATLTYDSADELTNKHSFFGLVSGGKVKLTIANGPVIEGPLDEIPELNHACPGNGTWSDN